MNSHGFIGNNHCEYCKLTFDLMRQKRVNEIWKSIKNSKKRKLTLKLFTKAMSQINKKFNGGLK